MTPPLDLDRLEELARAATPGPWVKVSDLPDYGVATENQPDFHPDPIVTLNRKYRAPWRKNLGCSEPDAEFIAAHNPETALALLAEVRRLRGALEHYAKGAQVVGFDRGEIAEAALKGAP